MAREHLDVTRFGRQPEYVLGRCLHNEDVVDVDSIVTGEILARLCVDCGTQLPAGWKNTAHVAVVPPTIDELTEGVKNPGWSPGGLT